VMYRQMARAAFATGIIGLAIVGFVFGDFAGLWQSFPATAFVRHALALASAALVLACGLGLLSSRTEMFAARVLVPCLTLLVLVLKLPAVVKAPLVEGSWQSMSELVVLLTAAWVLATGSARATRIAQLAFGLALIPLALSHFVYVNLTAPLVPAWLPYHAGWAYFTGAAHLAAALGILLGVLPRLAASMEAAMLTIFTLLVWVPAIVANPSSQGSWSELTISWAMSAAAWVVAASFPGDDTAYADQGSSTQPQPQTAERDLPAGNDADAM
jgi:uncharacterized membrane protein